jgi:arabinose-5-phosphate isomerase
MSKQPVNSDAIQLALQLIEAEAAAVASLSASINESFRQCVELILQCRGRIIVTGIGKSGHIGRKIAATFASTGTPSLFVHPAEASHGDLGMIEKRDIVIAISKSGESPELSDILTYCRRFAIPMIAITARAGSSLGRLASHLLLLPDIDEACPLGLVPTTSTTMMLVLGDALAVACLKARDFQPAQFREFHPGGKLGQKLTRVKDVMHGHEKLPLISEAAEVRQAIVEMSRGRFGCVGVCAADGKLIGVFTDGDLRRHIDHLDLSCPISALMTRNPYQIDPDALVEDVSYLFTEKRIPSVFVCQNGKPVGLVHVHDLLQKGFV